MWTDYRQKARNLGQRLAQKLVANTDHDPSKGFETACKERNKIFIGEIAIEKKENAIYTSNTSNRSLNL